MSRLSGLYSLGTVGGAVAATAIVAAGFDASRRPPAGRLLAAASPPRAPGLRFSPGLSVPRPTSPGRRRGALAGAAEPRGSSSPCSAWPARWPSRWTSSPGEWATFRVTDDLGGTQSQAALAFVAFTVGMTCGRLAGDRATARLGEPRLLRGAVAVSATGLVLAAALPGTAIVLTGFLLAGLGISVVSPLLTAAAGRTPGPAFTAMFVGNRLAGLLTPLAMGALAGTAALGVGEAMILLVVPSAALLLLLGTAAVRPPRSRGGEIRRSDAVASR